MGSKARSFRLLADALRGIGAPFGGARRIEFLPALSGGIATADFDEPDDVVLESLELRAGKDLDPGVDVLRWIEPGNAAVSGSLTAGELKNLVYEGGGTWKYKDEGRFRLLSHQHVIPSSPSSARNRFFEALCGNGEINSESQALVRFDENLQYEAVCPITSLMVPALQLVIEDPESVRAYLEGPQAKTTVLTLFNPYTEKHLQFDLRIVLEVEEPEAGIFKLGKEVFGVLAFRPVTPESVHPSAHGFTMPLFDFRPPTATVH